MKKIFWITLILCLFMPLCVYAIDGSYFDADNDGDVDAEDLAGFAQFYGTLRYYKDFDGDYYSDGTTLYSTSQPTNYFLESDLIATVTVTMKNLMQILAWKKIATTISITTAMVR